jgi:pSer/pThr/pTyr-binding forkhead associated (FHA) protein
VETQAASLAHQVIRFENEAGSAGIHRAAKNLEQAFQVLRDHIPTPLIFLSRILTASGQCLLWNLRRNPDKKQSWQPVTSSGRKPMSRHLEIIKGPDKGRTFALRDGAKLLLGRSSKTENPLSDRNVSRAHCEFKIDGDRVLITDLDSQSGTFVNGKRVKEHVIQPGDVIAIGSTQIRYLDSAAEEDSDQPVVRTDTVQEPPKKPVKPTETIVEPPRKAPIPTDTLVEPPRKPGIHGRGVIGQVPEGEPKKTDTVVEMHPPRLEGRERAPLNPPAASGLQLHWAWLLIGVALAFAAGVGLTWLAMRGL